MRFGMVDAIAIVAGLTALSGLVVMTTPSPQPMVGIAISPWTMASV
jgi:hypothetical protein